MKVIIVIIIKVVIILLLKGVSETIQSEAKQQGGGFLSMLLGTLGASFFRNMLAGKGINRAGYVFKDLQSNTRKHIIRADYGSKLDFYYSLIV